VADWCGAVEVAVVVAGVAVASGAAIAAGAAADVAVAAVIEGDASDGGVDMDEAVVRLRRCRVGSVPIVALGEGAPEACGVAAVTDGVCPRNADDGVGAGVRFRSGDSAVRPSPIDREDARSRSTSCSSRASLSAVREAEESRGRFLDGVLEN